jgi:predicted dienelactone hydrolase
LIIISHGNGGAFSGHGDTALALADAGFVVAAATHTGDNFEDQSYAGKERWFSDRPRHVARVIDYVVGHWTERARIDQSRIGLFGFSMGGFTGLVSIGAAPDFARIKNYCVERPQEFTCVLLSRLNSEVLTTPDATPPVWVHDARIKAAVLASPGFPYAFAPEELASITIPVQLWASDGDESVRADEISQLHGLLSEGSEFHLVENAGHFVFLPPCNFSPQICADPPGFDRAEFHRELNASIISFFTEKLDVRDPAP